MNKLVSAVLGAIMVLLIVGGGPLVWFYERAPVGWPNLTVGKKVIFGCCTWTIHLPGAGSVTALTAQLAATAARERAAAAAARAVAQADAATSAAASAHDAAAQAQIRVQTQTVIKEITRYVTPAVDARFPLPWSFVRVHDAAARGVDVSAVSIPAGAADDAASGVTLSAALAVVGGNYGACRQDDKQLSDLIAWIRDEQANHQPAPK